MNTKKLLISSALVASLTIGAAGALAQSDTGSTTPDAPPALGAQRQFGPQGRDGFRFQMPDGPMGQGQFGPQGRFGQGEFGPRGRGGLGMGSEMIDLAMQYSGLSLTELQTARRDGQTLAELIEANGQSVDAFVADVVASISARIDEQQALQAQRIETFKSTLADRVTAQVNGEQYQPPAADTSTNSTSANS